MKHFTFWKSFFLLCALIVGSNAWATDFTLSSAASVSKDGITITFAKGSGSTAPAWYAAGLRLYASNTITIESSNAITGITFNWEKQGNKTFASVTASTGSYTHPSAAGQGTWETTGNTSVTSVTFTLGSFGQLQLNTLSVTTSGGITLLTNDLTLNETEYEFDLANGAGQTLQLTNLGSADGALSYQSNNTAVATVSNTGLITAVSEGTARVTVTQEATSTYNGGTTYCDVTVIDSRYTISTLNFTGSYGSNGATTKSDNNDPNSSTVTWTVSSDGTESTYDSTKGIHYGTGSAAVQYITLSTSDINGIINKVVVNASTASGVSATVDVKVGGSAFGGNAQSLSTSPTDYTFTATGTATGQILVTVTKESSSTGALYVKSVKVYYEPSTDPIIVASDPDALAYNDTSGEFGYSITNPTSATLNAVSNSEWITNVAVDGTNSKVTFSTSTNTGVQRQGTITLSYTDAEDKVITITQAAAPVISTSDVNIAYDATNGSIEYNLQNATGNVTASITTGGDWLTSLGTITASTVAFNCTANTVTTARTATVTLSFSGASDKVVTVTQAAAPSLPIITVTADNPVNVAAAGGSGELALTYANLTIGQANDFAVQFYDANDDELQDDPEWVAVVVEDADPSGYKVSYVVDPNNGASRTAYFTVWALNDVTPVYSNKVTLTQAAYEVPIVPAVAGQGAFVKVTSNDDLTNGTYLIVYEGDATHDAVAFNGSLTTLDVAYNGIKVNIVDDKIECSAATAAASFEIKPSNGTIISTLDKYIGNNANSNGLSTNDNELTNTFNIPTENNTNNNVDIISSGGAYLRYNYASNQLRFRYYKSSSYSDQQAIALYKYDATEAPFATATIAANKEWITFCYAAPLDFSSAIDGLEGAYTITGHSNGATTLTATKMTGTVKAGTGLLLHAETVDTENAQVIVIPVAESGTEQTNNMLVGVTTATIVNPTEDTNTNLGLKNGSFVPYSQAGTLAAGKAYLQIPTADMPSNGAKLTIIFGGDGETTNINLNVNDNLNFDQNAPRYNMAGQRVSDSYKGIVIVNGKKYINK